MCKLCMHFVNWIYINSHRKVVRTVIFDALPQPVLVMTGIMQIYNTKRKSTLHEQGGGFVFSVMFKITVEFNHFALKLENVYGF